MEIFRTLSDEQLSTHYNMFFGNWATMHLKGRSVNVHAKFSGDDLVIGIVDCVDYKERCVVFKIGATRSKISLFQLCTLNPGLEDELAEEFGKFIINMFY